MSRPNHHFCPRVEPLEGRNLLATGVTASLANGVLRVVGTDSDDSIVFQFRNDRISIDEVPIAFEGRQANSVAPWRITRIRINALAGNDFVFLNTGGAPGRRHLNRPTVIRAGDGDDSVFGPAGPSDLYGGPGNDGLRGGARYDFIDGGDGNDTLSDEAGGATLLGGNGDDSLYGASGHDLLEAGPGNDVLAGVGGHDVLSGGDGHDWLSGYVGDDMLFGGPGNDTIWAGAGDDYVDGGEDNDSLIGEDGNDSIWAGTGNDSLWGEDGNDTLYGQDGDDQISGRAGADFAQGGAGNDTLWGGYGHDWLEGNDDDDRLLGEGGEDSLWGLDGDDYLFGGAGSDLLAGGWGNDTFRMNMSVPGFALSGDEKDRTTPVADEPVPVTGVYLTDPTKDDMRAVNQRATPTCAFLGALAAVARWTGRFPAFGEANSDLLEYITYNPATDSYGVLLYVNGSWNTYWVNGDWTEKTDPGWPLWVTLYQKAYLQAMNVVCRAPDGTYLPFEQWHSTTGAPWKSAGAALTALTGWDYTWVSASSMGAQQMRSRLLAGDILVAATPDFPPSSAVVGDHNYVVCDVYYQNGQWKVLLYNPWGRDGRVCTDGNDDGMVTLGWSEFVAHFSGYRWV